jgi:hypothetical protein
VISISERFNGRFVYKVLQFEIENSNLPSLHRMKKYVVIIVVLALIKLTIHFIGNSNYGFHRDELLHLSVSEHLDWGYMEFPPFIAFVGRLSHFLFDYTVFGTRVFPTLAGVLVIIFTCLVARELGGNEKSILIAGICALCFLPFFRNHTLFQPVAFEQLFWIMGLYFFIRYLNTGANKFLILLGFNAGFGLLNKYTFLLWGVGLVAGIIFLDRGRLFKNKYLYIAGAIAVVLLLPNVIWQIDHNLPIVLHQQKLQQIQLANLSWWKFATNQFKYPLTLAVSIIGVYGLFAHEKLQRFKSIGIFALVIFGCMWATRSKSYYFFATYPVLFAAGGVMIECWIQKRNWIAYTIVAALAITSFPFIPDLAPVLPIETFVKWKNKKPNDEGRIELTNDYADMFGWEDQVKLVDSVYQTLTASEKSACVLWAENYGEAGAIKILGDRYNLPDPICAHGSFWLFGPGTRKGAICISLGNEKHSVERVFTEFKLVKIIRHKYAIGEEHNIPLYLCRNPRIDLQLTWPGLEKSVFN